MTEDNTQEKTTKDQNTDQSISEEQITEQTTEQVTEQEATAQPQDNAVQEQAPEAPETAEEQTQRERAEYLAGWQRAQADMTNLKKRHEEEKKLFTAFGKEQLLSDLIPMIDNFEAAFSNKEVWESVDSNWRVGIEYIYSQFQEVLANNGVEQFGAEGDAFNATLHEALETEGEGETIKTVMQKGYKIGERIIRPAKVKLH